MNGNRLLRKQKLGSLIVVNKTSADVSTRSDLNTSIVRNDDKRKTGRKTEARRFL